jgi:hypothetical protein
MISQKEQLQRFLDKVLFERYPEIQEVKVFTRDTETPELYVRVTVEDGSDELSKKIENEVKRVAKLVSIPLTNVLVIPNWMYSKDN